MTLEKFLESLTPEQRDFFDNVDCSTPRDLEEAQATADRADEAYIGELDPVACLCGNEDREIAYAVVDLCGGVDQLDRETLERYFNYEAYGRDCRLSGDVVSTGKNLYWGNV